MSAVFWREAGLISVYLSVYSKGTRPQASLWTKFEMLALASRGGRISRLCEEEIKLCAVRNI